jgi:hypothetical protein
MRKMDRMSGFLTITLTLATSANVLLAQAPEEAKSSPLLPTGLVSKLPPVAPLTPREKASLAFRNTFAPRALANRLLSASIDQLQDYPSDWPGGMEGFGMRLGSRMGIQAVRNSIRLGTDLAFKIEPRYDRCNCTGFWKRTGHAWRRVIISRSDSGGEMPALSNYTSAYVTPMISYTWYPDDKNTWENKLQSGTLNLSWRGVTNMLREFWPEVKKTVPFRRD